MGRDTGPKCRQCRREGEKLFIKGERCYSRSCPINRRNNPPGERSRRRRPRRSQYYIHLREKQKVRRMYRVRERQFRRYVEAAKRRKGVTGEALLTLLERRLDNTLYRGGFASSRDQARQLIVHGHFELNGRSTDRPSILLREGDTISVKEGRRSKVQAVLEANADREIPTWLERSADAMKLQLLAQPRPDEVVHNVATNLIVEYYSR
ncbi:MAG: 30S ribosomal protein S4 [Candidatus Bipolaricaulota bacterium]|nr:MAG: 30S ribosomal protein S4 [Candidatus Bipolaricaulota bacterium]